MTNQSPTKLTEFEKAVLKFTLSEEAPRLVDLVENLIVEKREYTVKGCYAYFEFKYTSSSLKKSMLGSRVYIEFPDLKHGAGIILFMSGDQIEMLELFTHGDEVFPVKITDFVLSML